MMLMLNTARKILTEDDSKLPFVVEILQELVCQISVESIRHQVLKCLLSTKLKVSKIVIFPGIICLVMFLCVFQLSVKSD